jgi:hypothetical protein
MSIRRFWDRSLRVLSRQAEYAKWNPPDPKYESVPLMDVHTPDDLRDISISVDSMNGGLSALSVEVVRDEQERRGVIRWSFESGYIGFVTDKPL